MVLAVVMGMSRASYIIAININLSVLKAMYKSNKQKLIWPKYFPLDNDVSLVLAPVNLERLYSQAP